MTELIETLQQCEPNAEVALVFNAGILSLTGVQQTTDRDAVILAHTSSGFEAELE